MIVIANGKAEKVDLKKSPKTEGKEAKKSSKK